MLEDIKTLLGIPENDTSLDAKLELILSATQSRLKALLGGQDPPEVLNYIITDVSVIRFNRIGQRDFLRMWWREKVRLFWKMILLRTETIFRHTWTDKRM